MLRLEGGMQTLLKEKTERVIKELERVDLRGKELVALRGE